MLPVATAVLNGQLQVPSDTVASKQSRDSLMIDYLLTHMQILVSRNAFDVVEYLLIVVLRLILIGRPILLTRGTHLHALRGLRRQLSRVPSA